MLKKKYLHRRSRNTRLDRTWNIKKYHRGKNIDLFGDKLPQYQSIRKKWNCDTFDITPAKEFIISKIGQPWNDVYSEIISKTRKKYRWCIDNFLFNWYGHFVEFHPIYDDEYIPRNNRGRILKNCLYIDMNGILVKKSEEEILIDAKMLYRREKLRKIQEQIEREKKENQVFSS